MTVQGIPRDGRAGLPCANPSQSFWLSEPNKFLMGNRSTEHLLQEVDIAIVGSGITGAAIARYLAEDSRSKDKTICMLEAREVCWGATGRNGGHCQPLLFDRNPEIARFELRNVDEVKKYIEQHNVPCDWRIGNGIRSFWTQELWEAAQEEVAELYRADPRTGELVKIFTDSEAMADYQVAKGAVGITVTEGAGQLWPYKYVTFIIEKLVRDGKMNLQTNTPVTSLSQANGYTSLTTPRGTIKARNVILATNGYTSYLLSELAPVITPVRCEMSALIPPKGSTRLQGSHGMVGAGGDNPNWDDYLVQLPFRDSADGNSGTEGGQLMFGGGRGQASLPTVGVWQDDVVDEGEARYLRKSLLRTLDLGGNARELEELEASHQWTGIKGASRDNLPMVGAVPDRPGVWFCGAYSGHGMPNATLCGKAVVEMVLDSIDGLEISKASRNVVDSGDLPESYLLTAERLAAAKKLPSFAELEAQGGLGAQSMSHAQNIKEQKDESWRCVAM